MSTPRNQVRLSNGKVVHLTDEQHQKLMDAIAKLQFDRFKARPKPPQARQG